jgi:nucleotide-binding universal stress UspA family protein
MSSNIIISFDGSDNDHDALALGRLLAERTGGSMALAYVRHAHETDPAREQAAHQDAEAILERGAQWLGAGEVARHVVTNASTAAGLGDLAREQEADVIVFGSDWHTTPGHVQPLQSATQLLEGGPTAIAIAAAGLRDRKDVGLNHVALPGGENDSAARETAEALAAGTPIALPTQENVDLLVVGSRPGAPEGRVSLSAAAEYLVETTTASVLALARGVAFGVTAKTHAQA